nr:DNA polymerase III subunit alpha [Thiorhodospira sibirica]
MKIPFVHLHLHTEFSLQDGLVRIGPLCKRLKELGQPACAVTDQHNLFGMVKFYKAALKAGIKPLIGADVWVSAARLSEPPSRLVLLCQNEVGYRHLSVLLSRAYQENQHSGIPIIARDWLGHTTEGLIALSAGSSGEIGRALLSQSAQAEALAAHWARCFPDRFYLELMRTGRAREESYLQAAVDMAQALDLPVVATNDVRFLDREDFEAHEARVCIHQGHVLDDPRRPRRYSEEQYLRSTEDMAALFADLPEALENTLEIATRCNLSITLGKSVLPDYPVPPPLSVDEYFRMQSRQGLSERLERLLQDPTQTIPRQAYEERLEIELDVICQMGFPGYFLIVADFIQWAKDNGIPVGPGRGSGAGSLVAYALKITDLDPLRYELLFERFLNPERVSMPDFDIDFCMEGRDRVIDYVAQRYGREKVSQIITHGTMAAKAVVRDVGRVLGHPYGFVDRIAKLIPFELGITLSKALAQEEELKRLYEQDEEVHTLIDLAQKLEGVARNAGKHAGGVVIAPSQLTDFSPLYCEADGQSVVTHFDKDDVEAIGLVKFDFLGLRTLTIINWAVQAINAQRTQAQLPPLRIDDIPLDDQQAFALLKRQETTAVFQLESRGMKELIKRLQPDNFEEIIALVALYRPGPLQSGMVDDFINRKHGRAKVEYPHPSLEPILKPTYGIILYQEQVMQIAQVLAGYSLGGADLLRRAMGKKKPEEMAQQREIFVSGSSANGVVQDNANYIFDLMEKFAGYGFNKTLAAGTRVYTAEGIKAIEDCRPGDQVFSMNPDGRVTPAAVVALHDHGQVSLWEVRFHDGTVERCTLDHKWLTHHGQRPLWQIMQHNESVWGVAADEALSDLAAHSAGCFPTRVVLRHPRAVRFVGWAQGYDLEVDHPGHNFLLASGLCCSNSHSAAYALVSYQTLWLKAHYPAAFMSAVLSADMDHTDKVVNLIEECRAMGLAVVPPHINESGYIFTARDEQTIIYGLGAIKGVGEAAIETVLQARQRGGQFQDLDELCLRMEAQKLNRRTLEALIRAGTLDSLGAHRASLMDALPHAMLRADQHQRSASAGQFDMFGMALEPVPSPLLDAGTQISIATIPDWDDQTRLQGEKETLGLYLTGHPIDRYETELRAITGKSIAEWTTEICDHSSPERQSQNNDRDGKKRRAPECELTVAGLIIQLRTRQGGRGKMGFLTLDDRTARIEVALFGEEYERFKHLLHKDQLVIVEGSGGIDEFNNAVRIRARTLMSLEQARRQLAKRMVVQLKAPVNHDLIAHLESLLSPHRNGPCPVFIHYENTQARAVFRLGPPWHLNPDDTLLEQLRSHLGSEAIEVHY